MYFELEANKIIIVWVTVCKLARAITAYLEQLKTTLQRGETFSMQQLTYVAPEWSEWLKIILHNVHMHVNPPMALGSGHQGLPDKCSVEVYKMHLQTPREKSLEVESESYRIGTSDLGVEVGLPTFELGAGGVAKLLHEWIERDAPLGDVEAVDSDGMELECDVERGDEEDEGQDAEFVPIPRADNRQMFCKSYSFAGVHHVANNANADSNRSMRYFDTWFKVLKVVDACLW
jgi:hypothetical protein